MGLELEYGQMATVRSNIGKLYAMQGLQNVLLFIGVLFPFFHENGISVTQYFLLQGSFSLAVLLLEIPSGYLSDQWGRKNTLVFGSLFACIGIGFYAIGTDFWLFLIGEILFAIGYSCYSGTTEAMAYDSLLDIGEERRSRQVAGNLLASSFYTHAIGSLVCGLIAITWGLRSTVWLTIPFMIISLGVSLLLVEPKRHKQQEKRHFKAICDIVRFNVVKNVPVRSIIMLSSLISAMTFALVWFTQLYQESIGLSLLVFGIPNAIAAFGAATLSKLTPIWERKMDDRLLFVIIVFVVVGCYILLGFLTSLFGLAIMLLGRMSIGIVIPVTTDIINRMTTSDIRATVLSTRNLSEKLIFAVSSPFLGYAADVYSLNQAMLFTGILGGVVAGFLLLSMKKVWKQIPS